MGDISDTLPDFGDVMTPPQELTEAEKRERILEEYKDRGDPPQGFADWYEYHQWKYDPEGGWSEEYKEQLAGLVREVLMMQKTFLE